MTFGAPYLLLGLISVPLAAIGYWVIESRRVRRSSAWSTEAMLPNIVRRPRRFLRLVPATMFLIGLTFLLVGFARPQQVLNSVRGGGPTIVIAIDVSGSMASPDVAPTRLRAARKGLIGFIGKLPSKYKVAVVAFGDRARLAVEPTFDRGRVIANLPTRVTPLSGTAIGDAINQAVTVTVQAVGKSSPGNPNPPGRILLVSDGAQTDVGTKPEDAAQHALVDGIPIDTVTVGTSKGAVIQPIKLVGGQASTHKLDVPARPTPLQNVAQVTNGTFLDSTQMAQLTRVYKNLSEHSFTGQRTHELNAAAARVALAFLIAGIALSGLWFGRFA